jgi:hypothetical protein
MPITQSPEIKFTNPSAGSLSGSVFLRFTGSFVAIVTITLLLVVGSIMGYNILTTYYTTYKTSITENQLLTQKRDALKEVQPSVLDLSGDTAIALPDRNPLLWTLSQLKAYLENQESVVITKFSLEGETPLTESVKSLPFTFELRALSVDDVLALTDYVSTIAPITKVDVVTLTQSGEFVNAKVVMSVYWSAYPTELSGITQPVTSLEQSDMDTLAQLSGLVKPAFGVLSPSAPTVRENPFN